ncbi:UNVERIFIED_CONTAM: putative fatty acyl-CoA reductase 4 [Sesamum angustifolium]|uniref:Fatty acyl-CoA reductase 4 n=1 Tax=Sesamum angustifolium TaxID=2727405 RepID=A0AAW2QRU4_9LAMI
MGETLDGSKISYLDINTEKKIIEEKLSRLLTQNAAEKEIARAMRDLGIERTLDSIFVAYGQGKLKFFVGDPDSTLDMIPGDMVVNCMVAAIASHSNDHQHGLWVYHVDTESNKYDSLQPFESLYTNMRRRINSAMRLAELYKPYVFFQGIFDDVNTENLRRTIRESNKNVVLNFDPKCIQWEEYFENTHFQGLIKYVLK